MKRRLALLFSCMLLLISVMPNVIYGGTDNPDKLVTNQALDFELTSVGELLQNERKVVVFSIKAINKTDTAVSFFDYWLKVANRDGTGYNVNLVPYETRKNTVQAHNSEKYEFYIYTDPSVEIDNLILTFIKWDFSLPGYERKLGTLQISSEYKNPTPYNESVTIQISDLPIKVKTTKTSINKNDKYFLPNIELELTNMGGTSLKLPELQYYIQTADKRLFPAQVKNLPADVSLDPLIGKKGVLTSTIPLEVTDADWRLVIVQNKTIKEQKIPFPLTSIEIKVSDIHEVSIGNEYPLSIGNNEYVVQLNELQRYPLDDNDLMAATLTLSTRSADSLPIPELSGYFKLDDNIKVETKEVKLDKIIAIKQGENYKLQFIGQIPYTYSFDSVKFIIQEKEQSFKDEKDIKWNDLIVFQHKAELMDLKITPAYEAHKYTQIGKSLEYTIGDVHTFKIDNEYKKIVILQVTNMEKRNVDFPKLVTQYKSKDGIYYDANPMEIVGTSKLKPTFKGLYYITASLPETVAQEDLMLLIGESIGKESSSTNGSDKTGEAKSQYINPVLFQLPKEAGVLDQFQTIKVYPYTIKLKDIGTSIDFEKHNVGLELDYELSKPSDTEVLTKKPKITLEIKDKGRKILSKTFDLEDPKGMVLGKHHFKETFSNNELFDLTTLKIYEFNVYYELEGGHKKLLATKELEWFIFDN